MTQLDLQFDLENLTPANASPVEANFNRIESHVNTELLNRDGTVAMTAQLRLIGDPVADLDAVPKQYVDTIMPVGIIMMYGGTGAPPGGKWAVCNGASLSTSTYAALFAIIGYTHGGAGGSFNVPNMEGVFPVGATAVAPVIPLGSTGGSRDQVTVAHTHTIDHDHAPANSGTESTFHNHAGVDHTHGVGIGTSVENAQHNHYIAAGELYRHTGAPVDNVTVFGVRVGDGVQISMERFNSYVTTTGVENQNHAHSVNGGTGGADRSLTTGTQSAFHVHTSDLPNFAGNSGSTGVAAAGTNMPPYRGLTFIMRVA